MGEVTLGEVTPRRRGRWRRRAVYAAVIFALAYATLLFVRWQREIEPAQPRAVFAGAPLVLGHRGTAGHREHSVEAFRSALAQGADLLELDLRLTADGVPVVAHDRSLARVYGLERRIDSMTLAEIRAELGKDAPLTLGEVFNHFPKARANLELKTDDHALADAVAAQILAHDRAHRVSVVSFHGDALERFRARAPQVATGASTREAAQFYLCYLLEVPSHPSYSVLQVPPGLGDGFFSLSFHSAGFIEYAHRHGLQVHYWVVDDEAAMKRLLERGADGIITNHPDRARRVIDALGESP